MLASCWWWLAPFLQSVHILVPVVVGGGVWLGGTQESRKFFCAVGVFSALLVWGFGMLLGPERTPAVGLVGFSCGGRSRSGPSNASTAVLGCVGVVVVWWVRGVVVC